MTTQNETQMIEREHELHAEIEVLKKQINESRQERRQLAADGDTESIEDAQEAYDEAEAKVDRLEDHKKAAETGKGELDARLSAGDETVSVDDMVNAEKAVQRLATLIKPAKAELQKAERALKPLLADQELAHLAANIIELETDVPVIIRRKPENAPDVTPAVILSQTEATDSYGTLSASGSVKVTEVGETGIDWRAVKAAFDDAGCEGSVSEKGIVLDAAMWPLPRLHAPSASAFGALVSTFGRAFHAQAMGGEQAQALVKAGYNPQGVKSTWAGLFKPWGRETLEVAAPGEAVGEATVLCALQHDRGESAGLEDIQNDLESLVSTFQNEAVGGWSEAGELMSIELVEVNTYRGHETPWGRNEVVRLMGEPVWPYTAKATLQATYRYEPTEEVS